MDDAGATVPAARWAWQSRILGMTLELLKWDAVVFIGTVNCSLCGQVSKFNNLVCCSLNAPTMSYRANKIASSYNRLAKRREPITMY
jgi:hypothetical protein